MISTSSLAIGSPEPLSASAPARETASPPKAWYSFQEVSDILGKSARAVRTALAGARPSQVRPTPGYQGSGRPPLEYHYTTLPQLWSHWHTGSVSVQSATVGSQDESSTETLRASAPQRENCISRPPAPAIAAADDIAIAQLRLSAVNEFWARVKSGLSREDSATETVRDWHRTPRERSLIRKERIGRWNRNQNATIRLGKMSARTLRGWVADYAAGGLDALVPKRKGAAGRKRVDIPEDLLTFIAGMAISTARADIAKAVCYAHDHWPDADWPRDSKGRELSVRTWQRVILSMDPGKRLASLGKGGARTFANEALPDIERDWDQLTFDALWEIDDITMDFYVHSQIDPTRLVRPYIYGIRRISTRQWVTCIISEVPITHNQVASMLGFAFATAGIPQHLTFERGTVSLSPGLRDLLEALGISIHQASLDGGKPAFSGSPAPDRNIGHSQSKAVFEANVRRLHGILWQQVGQVGPDERDTAPQYMDRLKEMSVARVREKLPPMLPHMGDARDVIWAAMLRDNATPHTGLQKVWDDATQKWTHLTPDQRAAQLAGDPVRQMDHHYIPAFHALLRTIPVTRNGIQVGRDRHGRPYWFGRDDRDLLALAGTSVTVAFDESMPEVCYVQEIQRCCVRYERAAPFAKRDGEFANKQGVAREYRNKFESLMSGALAIEGAIVEQTISLHDPTAETRTVTTVSHDAISRRVQAIRDAAKTLQDAEQAKSARFDLDSDTPPETSTVRPRRGNLRAAASRHAEVAGVGI